ncbi:MAG: hypothetical protein ACR2J8_03830 [Thermomicrobiales bacterium]
MFRKSFVRPAAIAIAGAILLAGAPALAATQPTLGNAQSAFDTALGAPDPDLSNLPDVAGYDVPYYGGYNVYYYNSKAVEVTLISDRDPDLSLTESDPKDWALSTAEGKAKALMPSDTTCGPKQTVSDRVYKVCNSKIMAKAVPVSAMDALGVYGNAGDMTVSFYLNYSQKIPAIDVIVGAPADYVAGGTTATTTTSSSTTAKKTPTPKASTSSSSSSKSSTSPLGNRLSCRYFLTQPEAQAYFDYNGGNSNPMVSMLDGDKDGLACEYLPAQ